jgi:streptogramin lyase
MSPIKLFMRFSMAMLLGFSFFTAVSVASLSADIVTNDAVTINEFPIPTAGSSPNSIAAGPDGNLWFTESDGNKIGRITTAGVITEFPIPTAYSSPDGITLGLDGNLWFTEPLVRKIGRITTAGVITEFTIPTANTYPNGITAGPDGNLWFTEGNSDGDKIGRITTAGVITEFPIPTAGSLPDGITLGPDGNLWFTEFLVDKIGRITTAGVITEFPIPTADTYPNGITAGPDGYLWFTEGNSDGDKIGRITTAGVIPGLIGPTAGSRPGSIAAGPDGNLWFTEYIGNKIGRITTAGVITEFPIPTAGSRPVSIAAGPDGNLWFTEELGNKIGRITTAGVITEFTIPTANTYPNGITAGPDGNLWFTEWSGNKIGQVIIQKPSAVNMSVAPGSLNFGNVNVGQSINQTIMITNQASSTSALTGSVGTLLSPFSVVSGAGAFNLPSGQSVTVTVQFSPTTAGTAYANLSVTHNATNQNNPVVVALSGVGINAENCAYTISPTSKAFNAKGGNLSVNVSGTGQTNCPVPPVVEDAEWISVSGTPSWKANKGTVKLAVAKNPGAQSRTAVVTIGGQTLTIKEDGAKCQLTALKPSSGKYPSTGGSGSFDITVGPQDCGWNVATTFDWIHLDTTTGTGNGVVTFHMDANGTGKNRTGKIDVSLAQDATKKKTFTVNESK